MVSFPGAHADGSVSIERVSQPRQTPLPIAPGSIVLGKYRVDGMLGRGGMGIVVAATDLELERKVAIKFVERTDEQAAARFLHEARAAARMDSEYVTRVFEVARLDPNTPFIVMERLEGDDLAKVLAAGRLPVVEAVGYVMQVCAALAHAHAARIVHRDLKPGNLFLHRRSDGSRVIKVLDFGVSKTLEGTALTESQAIIGSPQYLAPEQIEHPGKVDHRTDIWALGVVAYELINGERPFRGGTMVELCMNILAAEPAPLAGRVSGVSEGLDAVLRRCLTKSMAARFDNVAELAEALAPFAEADAARLLPAIQRAAPRPVSTPATPHAPLDARAALGRDSAMDDTVDNGLEQRAARTGPRQTPWTYAAIGLLLAAVVWIALRTDRSGGDPSASDAPLQTLGTAQAAAVPPAPPAVTIPDAPPASVLPEVAPPPSPGTPSAPPAPQPEAPTAKLAKPTARSTSKAAESASAKLEAAPAKMPPAAPAPPSCRVIEVIENGGRVEPAAGRITFEWARRLCQSQPRAGGNAYSLSESGISVKCACD
jgi:eukaryotic-like serine/threonine-protein kinase